MHVNKEGQIGIDYEEFRKDSRYMGISHIGMCIDGGFGCYIVYSKGQSADE